MRVVSGQAKGRRLKAPPGQRVRPTPAKVKEALFSILAHQLIDTEKRRLLNTGCYGNDNLVEDAKTTFYDINVTVRYRIERSGIDGNLHRFSSDALR